MLQKIEFLVYLVVPEMLGPFQIDRACKNTREVLFSAPELDSGKKLKIQKNRFYEKVPHGLPMGSPWAPMESPWVKSQKPKVKSQKNKSRKVKVKRLKPKVKSQRAPMGPTGPTGPMRPGPMGPMGPMGPVGPMGPMGPSTG